MEADWHVVFEDGTEIVVRRACNRCYGSQVSVAELAERGPFEVVSAEGTVHARSLGEGETACGIPTTGPGWWTAPDEMPSGLSPTAGTEAAAEHERPADL